MSARRALTRWRWLGLPAAGAVAYAFLLLRFWPAPGNVLAQGAIVGLVSTLGALGIAVVYRATRCINFAQVSLGVVPAMSFAVLYEVRGWPFVTALAVAVVAGAAVGYLTERAVIRWFSSAPRLVLLAVTVAISDLLARAWTLVPSHGRVIRQLPDSVASAAELDRGAHGGSTPFHAAFGGRVSAGGVTLGANEIVALALVLLVGVALGLLRRRSRTALALSATGENLERAQSVGISAARMQNLAWVVAGVLSTLALVLRGGIYGLADPTALQPGLLLRMLAIALIGRMERVHTMVVAGVAIGILEAGMLWQWRTSALLDPMIGLVLVVTLFVRHRGRLGSAEQPQSSWSDAPVTRRLDGRDRFGSWALAAAAVVLVVGLSARLGERDLFVATLALILGLAAISVVVLTGWAGEFSLAPMALVGVGAAAGAVLSFQHHVEPVVALLCSGVVAAAASGAMGALAGRIRGQLLVVVTFAFAVAASSYLLDPKVFTLLPRFDRLPIRARDAVLGFLSIRDDRAFAWFVGAVVIAAVWSAGRLRASRLGDALVAVRENPRRAESFGISAHRARLVAFVVSGFYAGVAGALIAIQQQDLPAYLFRPEEGIRAVAAAIVGGVGSVVGAVSATVGLRWMTWYSPTSHLSPTIVAVAFVLVLAARAGVLSRAGNRLRRRGPVAAPRRGAVDHRPPTLRVRELSAGYGSQKVVRGFGFDVDAGEIVGLVGANGAGKSTVLRAVAGLLEASGSIELEGVALRSIKAHERARRGIALVPSGGSVFGSLTVRQNLALATGGGRRHATAAVEDVLARLPRLRSLSEQRAATLSGGERQLLSVAMAIVRRPRVLLIDELAAGVAPAVLDQLVRALEALAADGCAVLVVEHVDDAVTRLASRIYTLGNRAERAGAGDTVSVPQRGAKPGPVVLRAAHLDTSFGDRRVLEDVSLSVRRGEIVAVVGPNGSGKSTLLDVLSGVITPDAGEVLLDGSALAGMDPPTRARLGLARSFQDGSLFGALTVRETARLSLGRTPRHDDVDRVLTSVGLDDQADALVGELSTGARRLLDVACQIGCGAKVLLLDEPSVGLAAAERDRLAGLLRRSARQGAGIVLVEHDRALVDAVADRVVALGGSAPGDGVSTRDAEAVR